MEKLGDFVPQQLHLGQYDQNAIIFNYLFDNTEMAISLKRVGLYKRYVKLYEEKKPFPTIAFLRMFFEKGTLSELELIFNMVPLFLESFQASIKTHLKRQGKVSEISVEKAKKIADLFFCSHDRTVSVGEGFVFFALKYGLDIKEIIRKHEQEFNKPFEDILRAYCGKKLNHRFVTRAYINFFYKIEQYPNINTLYIKAPQTNQPMRSPSNLIKISNHITRLYFEKNVCFDTCFMALKKFDKVSEVIIENISDEKLGLLPEKLSMFKILKTLTFKGGEFSGRLEDFLSCLKPLKSILKLEFNGVKCKFLKDTSETEKKHIRETLRKTLPEGCIIFGLDCYPK